MVNTYFEEMAGEKSLLKGVVSFHRPSGWKTIPLGRDCGLEAERPILFANSLGSTPERILNSMFRFLA